MWSLFARIAAAGVSIFASAEVLKFLTADQNYADVVNKITDEINYAHCLAEKEKDKSIGVPCGVYYPAYYGKERVRAILNVYITLLLDNPKLPEYDALNAETLKNSAPTIFAVAKSAGENDQMTVRNVLGQLFWSTEQQRVHDTSYIRPRTARENAKYRGVPDQYKNDDKNLLDKAGDYLETIGTVLIAGAVIYGGVLIYNEVKSND